MIRVQGEKNYSLGQQRVENFQPNFFSRKFENVAQVKSNFAENPPTSDLLAMSSQQRQQRQQQQQLVLSPTLKMSEYKFALYQESENEAEQIPKQNQQKKQGTVFLSSAAFRGPRFQS